MLDFFERQKLAKRRTFHLLVLFFVSVVLINLAVYAAVVLTLKSFNLFELTNYPSARFPGNTLHSWWWDPKLFVFTATITTSIILGGALVKMYELRQGGRVVAELLGGELIPPNTKDLQLRRLLNVVEEMAIASGLPIPKVYVLPAESINAFAAGLTYDDAVVAVTKGSLRYLTRDELQGVIAHEFSHILNGDSRINLRLISLIYGITCLSAIGKTLLRARSSRRRGSALPLLGLALILIGAIGTLLGRLIQAAISRQRELLADASAVQFTRNPLGLAGALKKIAALSQRSYIDLPHVEEAAHLFFENTRRSRVSLLATHPPLEIRIRALDPTWDGTLPKVVPLIEEEAKPKPRTEARKPTSYTPAAFIASVGTLTPEAIEQALYSKHSLDPKLLNVVQDPLGAMTVVFAMLVSTVPEISSYQKSAITAEFGGVISQEALDTIRAELKVDNQAKLTLLKLALPALGLLSETQLDSFLSVVDKLIKADREIDLFEFAALQAIKRHLISANNPTSKSITDYYSFRPLLNDCAIVIASVAFAGSTNAQEAALAYHRGWTTSPLKGFPIVPIPDKQQISIDSLEKALDKLARASQPIKQALLVAATQTAAHDGNLTESEVTLLRAISDAIGCPIPNIIKAPENLTPK